MKINLFMSNKLYSICCGDTRKSQLLFLLDGILINGAYVLTTGVVLSGYVLYLGAQDFIVALLNNSMNFSTILCLFSFLIFERLRKRKKVLLMMNLASRLLICLIILLPLVFHNKSAMVVFLAVMVITSDVIWGIYRVGWIVWMMKLVPEDNKTRYVYFRMFLIRIIMSVMTLGGGLILDYFKKGYTGFVVVFGLSFIMSLLDVIVLKGADETEYEVAGSSGNFNMLMQPVKPRNYRNFLTFIFSFYLVQTMATSFTSLYLLKYLKLDYSFISTVNVISLIVMVMSNRFWEKVEGRKGFRFVMGVTAAFMASELFILSFLTKNTYFLLFLSTIVSGIGNGGFNVSIFTYRYEIMPENGKTMYEGWFYFASGLGMLIAPFAGKFIMNVIPQFSGAVYQNSKFQLLYLVASLVLCVLIFFTFVRSSTMKTQKGAAVGG